MGINGVPWRADQALDLKSITNERGPEARHSKAQCARIPNTRKTTMSLSAGRPRPRPKSATIGNIGQSGTVYHELPRGVLHIYVDHVLGDN